MILFYRLESSRFKKLLEKVQYFVSCRLFPPKQEDLPPMTKCSWWIPCATKVLALFSTLRISFICVYIAFVEYLSLEVKACDGKARVKHIASQLFHF